MRTASSVQFLFTWFLLFSLQAYGTPPSIPGPTYAVPSWPVLFELDYGQVSATVRGFDITTQTGPVTTSPPGYREGDTLRVTLHWVPQGVVPSGSRVEIAVTGSGPSLSRVYQIPSENWKFGVCALQSVEFPHSRGIVNGEATLGIRFVAPGDTTLPTPLFAGPVRVAPVSVASLIPDAELSKHFGSDIVRLNTAFRLGRNAELTLRVPGELPWKVGSIGLVSSTSYDADPMLGEAVCTIRCGDLTGTTAEAIVAHGVSTAKSDHDYYKAGKLQTRKITVFSSSPAKRPAADGTPFETHTYAGIVRLERAVRSSSLSVAFVGRAGIIDVKEIVLLPAADDHSP